MARIVCVSCGTEIGQCDEPQDIAAGYCDKCRSIQDQIEKLQDDCLRQQAARIATASPAVTTKGCGTVLILNALFVLVILVAAIV